MYNVFTDFHHASLLNSLIMLFEGRLGGNVYRPIGEDWYPEFWKIYDHPETVKQYLTLDQGYRPIDGTPPLNILEEVSEARFDQAEIYYCRDIESDRLNKAITLETFKSLPIDIVIASIPEHIEPFKELIRRYKPNAKLIYQVGNDWRGDYQVNNIMASAIVPMTNIPNSIVYHQEFDVDIFKPTFKAPYKSTVIHSFINLLQSTSDWPLFLDCEALRPEWIFQSYGGQCRDGAINGSVQLAIAINFSSFVWQVKPGGDGYGHILFNAAACGKPLIVKKSYYDGKLGGELLIDGETCINIDNMTAEEVIGAIEFFSRPDRYAEMSRNIYKRFKQVVDFDREFEEIKQFLERLI